MEKQIDTGVANNQAYDIVAKITNPGSWSYMDEFPGLDKLGFDETAYGDVQTKHIAEIIYCALDAGRKWEQFGDQSYSVGRIATLLEFGIVTMDEIERALWAFRRANDPHTGEGIF